MRYLNRTYRVLPTIEPRRLALVAIAWILLATPMRVFLLLELGGIAPATWTIARLDSFGWGMLIALAPTLWLGFAKRFDPRLVIATGAALFVNVVLFAPYVLPGGRNDNVFGATWIALAMALITFGVVNYGAEPRQPGRALRALAWCGARCYSLYLLHVPILGLIFLAAGQMDKPKVDDLATLGLAALAAGLTLIAADFCYRRVELPFMELAGRLAPHRRQAVEAVTLAAE